jgi:hypothetical protein
MAISSSGAITTTGVISGSDAANAISASYAQVATSASFASVATSASFASNAANATSASQAQNAVSSSFAANAANSNLLDSKDSTEFAITGSNIFTGIQYITDTSNPNGFGASASIYTDGGLRVTKDTYVSGTMFVNNLTVFGTQSINYITSSQLNISTNIISVNTDTPSIRFGGLSVYDSGSTGLTGSMLWDSERDHWVYSNPSGSSYNSGMMISGPRNSGSLGTEQGTLNNYIVKGQGGDHVTSSQIIDDGTTVRIPGNLQVTGSLIVTSALTGSNATFSGNVGIGTSPSFLLDLLTGSAGSFNTIAQIFNNDFTTGNRSYLRVRQQVGAGSSVSSYFGAGQDSNLYIIANNSARGGDLIINGGTGAATFVNDVVINGKNTVVTGLVVYGSNNSGSPAALGTSTSKFQLMNGGVYGLVGDVLTNGNTYFQSQRVDGNTAAYNLSFQPLGGNVGIGTSSPTGTYGKLSVAGGISILNDNNAKLEIGRYSSGASNSYIKLGASSNSLKITNTADSADIFTVENGGNVGIGTTIPSAWASPFTVIQGGTFGQHIGFQSNGPDMKLGTNNYYNGSGYSYTVSSNGAAQLNIGGNSGLQFNIAPSGTAGDTAVFTTPFVITSAGRIGIQNGSPQGKLEVGIVNNNTTAGGHFFSSFQIPVNTWYTVFYAPSNDQWNAITEFTWVSAGDFNRSGAAYMRWAYNGGSATLGVVYTLFNNSQNADASFRKSGNEIQVFITGGAADYYVQVRIQGSKAA